MGNCIAMQEKNGTIRDVGAWRATEFGTTPKLASEYLVPVKLQREGKKKKVVFAEGSGIEGGEGSGVVRIKLIISRKELRELLERKGVPMDGEAVRSDADSKGWKPSLESIPEL